MMDIRNSLYKAGCVLEGKIFFALKKPGLVSRKYINIDPLFTRPEILRKITENLLAPFAGSFDCLVGPATGGIPLVFSAAASCKKKISTAFGEKDGAEFTFQRMGFSQAVRGRNVLILEDISSTGDSPSKMASLVKKSGGNLVGASLIWNRGGVTAAQIGVPRLHSLVTEAIPTWKVEEAPPKWGRLPLVEDIGHPEYYPDYPGPKIKMLI